MHVFTASVLEHASVPVSIAPIRDGAFHGVKGSNAFTYSRFAAPYLVGFSGRAVFMDGSDMLVTRDIKELDDLFDPRFAVQVVKHPKYSTQHRQKYMGTSMQCPNRDYERKNWASVMLINADHPAWGKLQGMLVTVEMLQLRFIEDELIGELPAEWNRLVDEGQGTEGAAVLHWTAGIPAFPHYKNAPGAALWHAAREQMLEVA